MQGIEAAFTGKLAADPTLRPRDDGRHMLVLKVLADSDASDPQWLNVIFGGSTASELSRALKKGSRVYVEGMLALSSWKAPDGTERKGLGVKASEVMPIGLKKRLPDADLGLAQSNCPQKPQNSPSKAIGAKPLPSHPKQSPDDPIPF